MNHPHPIHLLITAAWMLAVASLGGETPAVPSSPEQVSTYEARGVLQRIDGRGVQATIAHEAIPGYMSAMTMSFEVRGAMLPDLKPGDTLAFRLCVTTDRAWIDQVRKTGASATPVVADAAREPDKSGFLPDVPLVNERGETVRVRDFRGEALAITFIYTRCPLPNYCPLMNRNFHTAQTLLSQLGAGENWHFLSVSLDPTHDTPAVLAASAENQEADARHWSFVTAPVADVRGLGAAVGLEFNSTPGGISHNLRTAVVDGTGQIRRIFRGNDWTPQELAAEMRAAMAATHSNALE